MDNKILRHIGREYHLAMGEVGNRLFTFHESIPGILMITRKGKNDGETFLALRETLKRFCHDPKIAGAVLKGTSFDCMWKAKADISRLIARIDEEYGTRDNSTAGVVFYGYPALRLPSGRICTDGSVMYYKIMDRNTGNMIWIHGKLLIGHHVAVINKKAVIYAIPEEVKDASRKVPFGYKRYEEKMKAGDVVEANDRLDTLAKAIL